MVKHNIPFSYVTFGQPVCEGLKQCEGFSNLHYIQGCESPLEGVKAGAAYHHDRLIGRGLSGLVELRFEIQFMHGRGEPFPGEREEQSEAKA